MVEICVHLLQEPLLEDAIRSGDCLAMLVDHVHAGTVSRNSHLSFILIAIFENHTKIPCQPFYFVSLRDDNITIYLVQWAK